MPEVWLELEGAESRQLQRGDLALVPHGEGHRLTSQPGIFAAKLFDWPRELVSERYEILRHSPGVAPPGGEAVITRLADILGVQTVHPLHPQALLFPFVLERQIHPRAVSSDFAVYDH